MVDLSLRPLQLECPDCNAPLVLRARLEVGAKPDHHADAETFASPTTTMGSFRGWLGEYPRFSTFMGFVVHLYGNGEMLGGDFQVHKFERPTTAFEILQYTGGADNTDPVTCRLRLIRRVEEEEE